MGPIFDLRLVRDRRGGERGRRMLFFGCFPVILVLMSVWPFGAHKVEMTNAESVPSAKGVVQVGHDQNNNTKIDLKVQYLAKPSALTPPANTYVVWVEARGHEPENRGELHVGDSRSGELKTVTPFKEFDIFVTAEASPSARSPEGRKVLWAHVSR